MLPIHGRPLLEYTIGLLRRHGVREIAINLHYQPEVVIEYFGDGRAFDVRLVYSVEPQLLGTAGAARRLNGFLNETFFVIYGDVLTDLDLSHLASYHETRRSVLTLALYTAEDPTRVGIVDVDAAGRVARFQEKPKPAEVFSDLANAGIYVAEPHILKSVPSGVYYDFGHDLLPELLRGEQPVHGYRATSYILDIGSSERYFQAWADMTAGLVRVYSMPRTADTRRSRTPTPPTDQS